MSLQLQKRDLGLAKAHTMIDRTVRILDSMIEIHGPRLTEVILANEEMVFKGIQLHIHKSVQKINSRQFFRSISNNLKFDYLLLSHHMFQMPPLTYLKKLMINY